MQFEITFDYLCPFARNANEAICNGLNEGREWDVHFRPFSLSQSNVDEGEADVFTDLSAPGITALHWGIAVRDNDSDNFWAAHTALFSARHDAGLDLRDESVIRSALDPTGVDVDAIAEIVASGVPGKVLAKEHSEAVDQWSVFGVPTFIIDDVATFVRLMDRGLVSDIDRVLELAEWQGLNEFKRTRLPR